MRFRSHVVRPLDPSDPWNRAIVALAILVGLIGAVLTVALDRSLALAIQAGGTTFLCWAFTRELDPDGQVSAMASAVFGGSWALIGQPTAVIPFIGLLMIARLLVETTGRRPLPTDLGSMAIIATLIALTPLGWMMGFGLGIAIHVDDRLAEDHNRQALIAAVAAAAGSSAAVSLTGALPETVPSIRPILVALVGLLALLVVAREPDDPVSFVDSRNKRFLRRDRLQAGRAAAGILVFVGALVSGDTATAVIPMGACLAFALVSSEWEHLRRSRPSI